MKNSVRAYVSLPQKWSKGFGRFIWLKYYNAQKCKLHSLYDRTLWKIPLIWKKVSSKSCIELNSLQKSQDAHMSSSPQERGLQRLMCFKNYNVEWESRFTWVLNAAKNTHYIQNWFQKKLLSIEFYTKSHRCMCLPSPRVELGGSKDCIYWNIMMFKNGEVD